MGPACPFAGADRDGTSCLPLVFRTEAPLFSASECQQIIDEAKAHLASGGSGSGFTLADTNVNLAVASLPRALAWLNGGGLAKVASLASVCFSPSAIGPANELLVYRALVVGYDHAAGLTHQQVHRDGSLLTAVVSLSERSAYAGGGTYIEALDRPFALERGHALLQASALRHAGHAIDAGERWVLVLFLVGKSARTPGEHVRLFKRRAQAAADEGNAAAEARCLTLARAICDDADHELLYDAAVGAHDDGRLHDALALYEKARALNPSDERVARNLNALHAQIANAQHARPQLA